MASDTPAQKKYRALKHGRERLVLNILKAVTGCQNCGFSDPRALEFAHRDATTKSFNVGGTAFRAADVMRAEIEKCDVLCANCHSITDRALVGA